MMKQVKGSSFHLDTDQIKPGKFFKWQGSQEAFTVSHDAIYSVAEYIRNQAVHHRQKSMISNPVASSCIHLSVVETLRSLRFNHSNATGIDMIPDWELTRKLLGD